MTLGPLPLWLSPSLLYSFHGRSALLTGRKTRCFDAGSRDQREALPEGCVDPAEKHHRLAASTSNSSSLLKELGLRDYSCVSECVSDSGQCSQGVPRTHKHTHTRVPAGRKSYWPFNCSAEKVARSFTGKFAAYFKKHWECLSSWI